MDDPVPIFLMIMAVLLVTPIISQWARLPGIVGLIIGGMLIGPHGLNLLQVDDRIELLSTIGLLYLMFSAGLEVDLIQFNRVRGRALAFGILTYMIPQLMGMGLGRWLGMSWLGAVLLGSAFSSHTLIAFPILIRLGIVRNDAVAVTVGATVLTDITAFIVLAGVLSIQSGDFSPGYFVTLLLLMVVYVFLILWLVPRIGTWFFNRFSGRTIEFQFVLVTLFAAALLAELIGVHAVVGAFLAGLAINATLPRHSPVGERSLFLGESLFIPIFLMYSGMITDPLAFFVDSQTIWIAVLVTLVAYISKFIAAWITGRIYHYDRAELMTVYGLSHAQAAVTIPTLVIGVQLGLFSGTVFNAAIMMILLTSITSPIMVERFGRKVTHTEGERQQPPLFERVMVPVANPETQEHLITLASILAHNNNGTLMPLNIVQDGKEHAQAISHQRFLLERVPQIVNNPEARVTLLRRVDNSIAKGIIRAAIENDATLIVMGWHGPKSMRQNILGHMLDEVVWNAPVPVLVGRIMHSINGIRQIVLAIPHERLDAALAGGTLEMVATMARAINVPLVARVRPELAESVKKQIGALSLEQSWRVEEFQGDPVKNVTAGLTSHDLLIVPTVGTRQRFRSSLASLPERLTRATQTSIVFVHYPD